MPLVYEIRAFWEDAAVGNGTGREGSARYRLTRMLETYAARKRRRGGGDLRRASAGSDRARHRAGEDHRFAQRRRHGPVRQPARRRRGIRAQPGPRRTDTVGFIGSFYDYEGLDDLIAAMPLVGGAAAEGAIAAGRRRADGGGAEGAGRGFAGRGPDPLRRPGAARGGRALLCADRHPRLSAQGDAADRIGDSAQAAGGDGAAQAGGGVQRRRSSRADRGRGDRYPVSRRRSRRARRRARRSVRAAWANGRSGANTARLFVERERNWSSNISRYAPVYQRLTGKAL